MTTTVLCPPVFTEHIIPSHKRPRKASPDGMASTTPSTITTTTTSNTNSETDADEEPLVFPDPPAVPWPRELLCRYPNKPCPHRRVPKRDGELHSYCAYHRHKAQQYQRKLDQKKKLRRRRSDDQDTETKLSDEHAVMRFCDPRAGGLGQPLSHVNLPILSASTPASHVGAVALEPFDRPVSLQDDDIHLLQALLLEEAPKHSGAHPYASRHQHPSLSPAFVVDLEGFSFTSQRREDGTHVPQPCHPSSFHPFP
ncbi:hypothetical protein PINS_up023680 [Pythium insidiosum]|nr:hypothetical protein PINS_up023680 [Pythium insidiosum]